MASIFAPVKNLWNAANPINEPQYKRGQREKDYGKTVDRWKRQGMISPGEQQEVVSGVTRHAGDVANRQVGNIIGTTAAQGLGQSGIVAEQSVRASVPVVRQAAETARAISSKNIASKIKAENISYDVGKRGSDIDYAQRMAQFRDKSNRRESMDDFWAGMDDLFVDSATESSGMSTYDEAGTKTGDKSKLDQMIQYLRSRNI